jgi:hypothetical protein
LFLAIRVLSPAVAALAGGLWGGCFYLFSVAGAVPGLSLMPHSFGLLAIVLMLYAYICVLLTRWIGFSPMLLALGWILVELALTPLGLKQGLLAGTQGANPYLHWISCLLGYALVALVSSARLRFPSASLAAGLPNAERCPLSQSFVHLQFLPLCELYPRPPPNIH